MSKTFGNRGEEKDGMEIKYGGIWGLEAFMWMNLSCPVLNILTFEYLWLYHSPKPLENLPRKNMECAIQQFWTRLNSYPYFTSAKLFWPNPGLPWGTLWDRQLTIPDRIGGSANISCEEPAQTAMGILEEWDQRPQQSRGFPTAVLRRNAKRNISQTGLSAVPRSSPQFCSLFLSGRNPRTRSLILRAQGWTHMDPSAASFLSGKRSQKAKGRKEPSV